MKISRKKIKPRSKCQVIATEFVQLGYFPIVALRQGSILREALRVWWNPYRMGPAFDALTKDVVHGSHIERDACDPEGKRRTVKFIQSLSKSISPSRLKTRPMPSARKSIAKVKIQIDYPINGKPRHKTVKIDRRYPGEIFGLLHDFYRELYAEDEARGGKAGPANGLLNRAKGPLIWGHDIGDLSVTGAKFRALKSDPDGAVGIFTFDISS